MNKSIFEGKITTNDPNLVMDFDGYLDLSKREKKYDFHADVEYANLKNYIFIPQMTFQFLEVMLQ